MKRRGSYTDLKGFRRRRGRVASEVLGLTASEALAAQFFLWGTTCTLAALVIDRRSAIAGVACLAAYFVAVQHLEYRCLTMAFPNTVLAIIVLWIYLGPVDERV